MKIMMKMRMGFLLAFLLLPSTGWAQAQNHGDGRACTAEDLTGVWDMIYLGVSSTARIEKKHPQLFPYQRFRFHADGSMKHMASTEPIAGNPAQVEIMNKSSLMNHFRVEADGWIQLSYTGAPRPEYAFCTYVLKEASAEELAKISEEKRSKTPRKGDILLRYFDGKGNDLFGKLLRKAAA